MPAPLMPKNEVVARLGNTFKKHGYEGASLSALSQETGLVKASLYHYFPDGKKAMAEAALDAFSELLSEKAIAPLHSTANAQSRLEAMVEGVREVYNNGGDMCLFALFSLGDTRKLFKAKIAAKFNLLATALAATLRDAGLNNDSAKEMAEQMIVEIEGALIVSRVTGDPGVFARMLDRLQKRFAATR